MAQVYSIYNKSSVSRQSLIGGQWHPTCMSIKITSLSYTAAWCSASLFGQAEKALVIYKNECHSYFQ